MANSNWKVDGREVQGSEGATVQWDDERFFTLTYRGKRFFGEILENATEQHFIRVKINHREFTVQKQGPLDELIAALGLDKPKVRKMRELQAPMPGRIVGIAVEVGQEINLGDEILSLEAMKMENVLKAEGVGVVKSILVKSGDVVDKGSVMIEFE